MEAKMPKPKENEKAVRLPEELVERIDAERERLRASEPGSPVSRHAVVRRLLWRALANGGR